MSLVENLLGLGLDAAQELYAPHAAAIAHGLDGGGGRLGLLDGVLGTGGLGGIG